MKIDTPRGFVLRFLVLACLSTAVVTAFNYGVDPGCRYRLRARPDDLVRLAASRDQALTVPENYDDRSLLKDYIRVFPRAGVCVMGGSRVLTESGEGLLNAGMTAGTIRDHVAIWQLLKEADRIPERILLCVDAQGLDRASRNDRWLSLSAAYERFHGRIGSLSSRFHAALSSLKDLTSLSTTRASIERAARARQAYTLVPIQDLPAQTPARTRSFSMIYPRAYVDADPEAVLRQALENGEGETHAFKNWNRRDDAGFNDLGALLQDMSASGVGVSLILMPYHPAAYDAISRDAKAAENRTYFRERLSELSRKLSVPFFDGMDGGSHGLDNGDFMDGAHMKPDASRRFFGQAVLRGPARAKGLYVSVLTDPDAIETRQGADTLVQRAHREGFSELFVQVYRANIAWFASEHAESRPSELGYLIHRAHEKGIKVHAWLNLLSLSANEDARILKDHGPSVLTRNAEPKTDLSSYRIDRQYFLEPGDPHVTGMLEAILRELLTEHPDLDGIHLDYIRYPDVKPAYGHTKWNLMRYREAGGVSTDEADPDWRSWKRAQVTNLVRQLKDAAVSMKPGILFSTSGLMTYTRAREESFQDWKEWTETGLTDFVTLMCYTDDPKLFERYLLDAERRSPGLQKVNIAVGAYKLKGDPDQFARQWDACERTSARSCVVLE